MSTIIQKDILAEFEALLERLTENYGANVTINITVTLQIDEEEFHRKVAEIMARK